MADIKWYRPQRHFYSDVRVQYLYDENVEYLNVGYGFCDCSGEYIACHGFVFGV